MPRYSVSFWVILIFLPIVHPQDGIFETILNSIQLGIKNILDRFVTDVNIPNIIPAELREIQFPDFKLPAPLGGGKLLSGCARCLDIDSSQLAGVWHMVYANDNFVRKHFSKLKHLPTVDSSGNFVDAVDTEPSFSKPISLMDLLLPMRYPACVRLDVGDVVDFGFMRDHPFQLTFHDSVPTGRSHSFYGRLRQQSNGKVDLLFATANYTIKLCVLDTNLIRNGLVDLLTRSHPKIAKLSVSLPQQNATRQESFRIWQPKSAKGAAHLRKLPTFDDFPSARRRSQIPADSVRQAVNFTNVYEQNKINNGYARADGTLHHLLPFKLNRTIADISDIRQNQEVHARPRRSLSSPQQLNSKFVVLSDSGDFPGCQSSIVITNDQTNFFIENNPVVMDTLTRLGNNRNSNPLQYIGCPYVMQQI